jgi:hypothetical protein
MNSRTPSKVERKYKYFRDTLVESEGERGRERERSRGTKG